jgi:methylglyoxal/glyoxal reductase
MPGSITDTLTLHNGVKMPLFGLGTWQSAEGNQVEQSVRWALDVGYRHIDTAAIYGNERGVGKAVRESGVPCEQIFVTTKLWNEEQRKGPEACAKAMDESLKRLGLDYVDLMLIHWPVKGRYVESWRVVEQFYKAGKAKAIGVSNFMVHHLQDVMKASEIVPMNNQFEHHPRLGRTALRDFCAENKITVTAWSPLMQGKVGQVLELVKIGEKYRKTPAQVALRWNIQSGVITIPKSVKRERLIENANIYDFALTPDEMRQVDALDRDERIGPDPDHITF